jgi:tRNA pseudouridine38-40 synthase
MTRWALLIEYDGTGFAGWQHQANGYAIQDVLENAAGKLAGRPVGSIVAGRTDAGVHAAGQVAHIDLDRDIAPGRLATAMNFHMRPHRVSVLQAARVGDDFSARFSATGRRYRFTIMDRPGRPALLQGKVWHIPRRLDAGAMQAGANMLLGRHDFTSFRAAACQANSPLRTLDRIEVLRDGDLVHVVAEARSFLHHQVRNMVGSLAHVGRGKWPPEQIGRILRAADRGLAGPTAPPGGLCLVAVRYVTDPFDSSTWAAS